MKITIDIPDDLHRKVKAKSTLEGRPVREVAIALFREWVERQPDETKRAHSTFDLMQEGCGIVDSGMGELSTNPKHLEGFGRD